MRNYCKPFVILFSLICLLTVTACHKEDPRYEKSEKVNLTLRVAVVGPLKFYFAKVTNEDATVKWNPIVSMYPEEYGWGLETGYEYEVRVWKHWLKEYSRLVGPVTYDLIKILSRKKVEPLTE